MKRIILALALSGCAMSKEEVQRDDFLTTVSAVMKLKDVAKRNPQTVIHGTLMLLESMKVEEK